MFVIEPFLLPEMTEPQLILEKLSIPAKTASSSRPRLLSLLENSLSTCTSTILSARAGAGKTTLAVDFAQRCGRSVAWYKVDAPDGDLSVFFEYLSASIKKSRPAFSGASLARYFSSGNDDRATAIAEGFLYALGESAGEPLLIVIEDLHLVCDSSWLMPFLKRLLPLLPPDVHLVITSRTVPPAPLWRMRSKQTLAVIDEESLKFNRQEAIELFEKYGLSREQAFIAFDHTHGRAAALASVATTLHLSERRAAELITESAITTTQG